MREVALGDLIKPSKVRRADGGNYPILSMTMHEGIVDQSAKFKKRIASVDLSGYKVATKGQLVVGFPIDEGVLDFQTRYDAGIVSPAYGIWDLTDASRVHIPYLKRFLRSSRALTYYKAKLRGSTARRRSLPAETFLALPVPLPSVDEQQRIAGILDQADAIRAKRRQVLAHLDKLTQSIFKEMFGTAKFSTIEFGSVVEAMRNGVSPSTRGTVAGRVLTLSAITQGSFNPEATKPATFDSAPSESARVDSRDFLICRGNGNKSLVGTGVRSRESRHDLVFPDTVIAARIANDLIDLSYLEAVWRQLATRRQIEAAARTTNGTYKVNQKALGSIQIPLPPLELQQAFSIRVEQVEAQRAVVQGALDADNELFASLQARAFRGEL